MTQSLDVTVLAKAAMLAFWGAWLGLAAFNNVKDPGTNRHLLGAMLSMAEIKAGEPLGQGLRGRAVPLAGDPGRLLLFIAVLQCLIAMALLASGFQVLVTGGGAPAILMASWAVLTFGALWACFLVGGLWFGYWIKTPQIQQVHFTLLLASVLTFLLLHQKS